MNAVVPAPAQMSADPDIVAPRSGQPLDLIDNPELAQQIRDAEAYIRSAHAPNTQRSYRAGWKAYLAWCRQASGPPRSWHF